MTYAELKQELKELPLTWYPDLLKTLVETSIAKGCWLPGGVTAFVNKIERAVPTPPVNLDRSPDISLVHHGIDCPKKPHDDKTGYEHAADSDGPFFIDGVRYCGRCHYYF